MRWLIHLEPPDVRLCRAIPPPNPVALPAGVELDFLPFKSGVTFKVTTLQGINKPHLGKRKIIFKMPFLGDMLIPWRVSILYLWYHKIWVLRLMEEILHQMRLVVYPFIYKVLAPSHVVSRIFFICLFHQQYLQCSLKSYKLVSQFLNYAHAQPVPWSYLVSASLAVGPERNVEPHRSQCSHPTS